MRSDKTALNAPVIDATRTSGKSALPSELHVDTGLGIEMDAVYCQYNEQVFRFLKSRVGNKEDAEDLAADTFLKASRLLDVSRPRASIASWLFTVARTVLADHWRKYYRHGDVSSLDETQVSISSDTIQRSTTGDEEKVVAEIIDDIPDKYGRVLELRYLRGYSVREIASELGVTVGNAKVIHHRALIRAANSSAAKSVSERMGYASSETENDPRIADTAA